MALIETNGLIGRIQRITGCNFIKANEVVEASPPVPAIPIDRIEQLREEIAKCITFDSKLELAAKTLDITLISRNEVFGLIDSMIKEYSE
ncbi:MAG: hypothetical protein K6A05_04910 [Lachnospiraceae bacterium]|nr:hypothetical protein [Lachnospiraceae bacterium]